MVLGETGWATSDHPSTDLTMKSREEAHQARFLPESLARLPRAKPARW